jgi:hypothetical protein
MTDGTITGPQARSLSPDEAEARAERCFEIDQRIKAGIRAGRAAMWEVAAGLVEFDDENGWTALGHENLGEWLADPEVGMSRSTFFRTVQSYRELTRRGIGQADLPELEPTKVQIVLPRVKAGSVKLADALADVRALGQKDLREKYLRRPDPADLNPPDDDLVNETQRAAKAEPTPPPDTPQPTSTPQWANGTPLGGDPPEDEEPPEVEVVEGDVVEEPEGEPAQNDDPEPSGQVQAVDPEGPSAIEVVEWIDRALPRESSPAMKRHALTVARKFIVALFPQIAELEAAAAPSDDAA